MASLPAKHPSLAIHMTDRATTPLISSSSAAAATTTTSSTTTSHPSPQQQRPHNTPKQRTRHHQQPTAFSTSPPSPTSTNPSDSENDSDDTEENPPSPATKQANALTALTTSALLSYDAAKRLGRGAPLRTMVELSDNGPVVLHSYMCPMGLALGVPGHNTSSASLATAVGKAGSGDDDDDEAADGDGERRRPPLYPVGGDDGGGGGAGGGTDAAAEGSGIDPSDPPMLTSTVVAPRAEDLREARRATARLEKVARVFQAEWVSTGRR